MDWFKYAAGLLIISIQWCTSDISQCPSQEPVCGTDGITYKNICHLKMAKLDDDDLQVLYDSSCYEQVHKLGLKSPKKTTKQILMPLKASKDGWLKKRKPKRNKRNKQHHKNNSHKIKQG